MNNNKLPIHVILEDIRSALNVGAIFRTCDAVSVEKLYLCGITAYPPHNKIPKTALGSVEYVDWCYAKRTIDVISKLKEENIKIVSVEIAPKSISYFDCNYDGQTAFVFGNEISGISQQILDLSDKIIHIPMFGYKKSLNVATSCGIVLYEALRQFTLKSSIQC